MMAIVRRVTMWRSLVLFVIGCALGATLVAPAAARFAAAPGSSDAAAPITYTRTASCPGTAFAPTTDAVGYQTSGALRYHVSPFGYTATFRCDPGLPHRAVVTRVRFTLRDDSPGSRVYDCGLVRSGLAPAAATTVEQLASIPSTGGPAVPGIVRLADTTIAHATIDHANFVYWLGCTIEKYGDAGVGIYGADVTYRITAANG